MRKLFLGLVGLLALALATPSHAVITTTRVGNAAYTITATDTNVVTSVAFSASRTWTLPSAAATCIGQTCPATSLQIIDLLGTVTAANTLVIAPATGDTINGAAANLILSAAGVRVMLIPTSGSNWKAIVQGDYRNATVLTGAAVALTTATPANVGSISLSQGEWSCSGKVSRNLNASTSVTILSAGLSATSATMPTLDGQMDSTHLSTAANVMGATGQDTNVGPYRFALAATTTIYLVANDTFTVSTNAAYGQISCQRVS